MGEVDSPLWHLGFALIGVAAGFVNTLAGGGSLLSLPALMIAGLPANIANATNRLAVLAQSLAGTLFFDREGHLDRRAAIAITLPTLGGSLVGAWAASRLPADVLKPVLLVTMMALAIGMLVRPELFNPVAGDEVRAPRESPTAIAALFGIGVYGGFLQVGVGIFLLAVLGGLLRYDLLRANAIKGLVVTAFTALSVLVFVGAGQVVWLPGLTLALGQVVGAWLGVRFAITSGQETLRRIVLTVAIVSCIAAWIR